MWEGVLRQMNDEWITRGVGRIALGSVVVPTRRNHATADRTDRSRSESWAVGVGRQAEPRGHEAIYGRVMDYSGQLVRRHVGDSVRGGTMNTTTLRQMNDEWITRAVGCSIPLLMR
jgi:hypothetical protein